MRNDSRGSIAVRWVAVVALLGLGAAFDAAAVPTNTTFVVINQTGWPDGMVHMKFLGSAITATATAQTFGDAQPLETGAATSSRSYALSDMRATIPNTPYSATAVPTFALNDYTNGRIYFSVGSELVSTEPPAAGTSGADDYNAVYQYVELFVAGAAPSDTSNIDISYVDFLGIPMNMAARIGNGSLYNYPTGRNPQESASGQTMFNDLIDANAPLSAIVPATIGGTARIGSPSLPGIAGYHDWSALFTYLKTSWSQGLDVSSYTGQPGKPLDGVLFGYGGGGVPVDPYSPKFLLRQDYAFTAFFTDDLNPGGANTRIPHLEGVAGVKLHGAGGPYGDLTGTGDFDLYIEKSDLDASTGVYGNNPPYTLDWTGVPPGDGGPQAFPKSSGIVNDFTGRVVGDLLAGMTFGWAGSETNIANHAVATGTTLPGGVFTETTIGELGTGKYFYLLSLQDTTADLAKWFGSEIAASADYYDTYGNAFAAATTAYTMPFGDRLQGSVTPSIWWEASDLATQNGYIEITLLPGSYVPEPASVSAILAAVLALAGISRVRFRARIEARATLTA